MGRLGASTVSSPIPSVALKSDGMKWGGQPWLKMQQYSLDYIIRSAAPLERIQYNRPAGTFADKDVLQAVWEDEIVMDEPSGSNRQWGFALLYEIALGHVTAMLGGVHVGDSFSQLMGRFERVSD